MDLRTSAPYIVSSVVGGIALHLAGSYIRDFDPANRLVRATRSHRWIKNFYREHIESQSFSKKATRFSPAQYYYRSEDQVRRASTVPYEFFYRKSTPLESAKLILIPPLDNRHGARASRRGDSELRSTINGVSSRWYDYFTGLGRKMNVIADRTGECRGQRIIFFDKSLFDLFLSDSDDIIERSGFRLNGSFQLRDCFLPTPMARALQNIVLYVHHVVTIHHLNLPFRNSIKSFYMDKAVIDSNKYYDFGLYRVVDIPIVYMPLFRKDLRKSLVGERIYIGNTRAQRRGITEFEEDFDELWSTCIGEQDRECLISPSARPTDVNWKSYSHEFFHRTYYSELREIFERRIGTSWNDHGPAPRPPCALPNPHRVSIESETPYSDPNEDGT